MKITYNPVRHITTADLFMACDPPIEFEVKAKLSPDWAKKHGEWENGGSNNPGDAAELIAGAFVSVSQMGEKFPLNSLEAVEGLRTAIEEDNKGEGDTFLVDLLTSFALNHYSFLVRNSAASNGLSRR